MKLIKCIAAACAFSLVAQMASAQTEAVIEINNTASGTDDYFCWSPVSARVKVITGRTDPVRIVLKSASSTGGGRVEFSRDPGIPVSAQTYSPKPKLEMSLPSDGSWIPFLVSGAEASTDGKDVTIVAEDSANGSTIGAVNVMVRVRKNANSLTALERDRFLEALAGLHGHRRGVRPSDSYEKYARSHGRAFELGIHGGPDGFPLFLAWHRAFLLSLERELQDIDPRVTVPYWRFDEDSNSIFVEEFMGRVGLADPIVRFSNSNPLFRWRMALGGPLVRQGNPTARLQDVPSSRFFETLDNIFANPGARVYGGRILSAARAGANGQIERYHHNDAHVAGGGWLASRTSPRDPVFFLLHANVDRAWAEWQARFNRFDPASPDSYSVQGVYPGPSVDGRFPKGSYALDEMWPWSRKDGATTPDDPGDNWPDGGFDFPTSPAGYGPAGTPTPAGMIDYMNATTGAGHAHGVCYSGLGFSG